MTPKDFSCSHIGLLYSPGRSWNKMDFLGLWSHDCAPAPGDRGCQLAVRHSGGSSWINSRCTENVSFRQTHAQHHCVFYIHRGEKPYKNMAIKIDKDIFTTSYGHHGNITWGKVYVVKDFRTDERSWLRILLFLAAQQTEPIHLSDALQELKILALFLFSFSPHSIPFPFTSSSSWHWKWAKNNVDPDSLAWSRFCRAWVAAIRSGKFWLTVVSHQVAFLPYIICSCIRTVCQ